MTPWYRSYAFKALLQTSVLSSLGWLSLALATDVWDWRQGLAIPLLSNVIIMLKAMWEPGMVGPLNVMNKNNFSMWPKP